MRWWDSLRTAFQLADRLEEVESQLRELQFEWTDIQDKLLAREERLRKRLSRELKASLSESPPPPPSTPAIVSPEGSQTAKREIIHRFRQLKEG